MTLTDYDYTRPRADLGVKHEDPRDTAFAHAGHYVWGDHAQPQAGVTGLSGTPNQPRDEADMLARVRMDALRCPGLRATGKGNLRGLEMARTFHLTHYPQKSANREYVVVSATLDIRNPDEATVPAGSGARYQCVTEFEIQPANAVFRSAQTLAKPTRAMETAIVTGPDNQEIWTDALGRVKVQFPWDRQGGNDQNSSCWLRVSSSWQGNRFGAQYVPRIGHEVMVGYVNNDPDLPIITGSVANAFNEPSWPLPDNHALSGVNSNELGNTGQSGRLAFDDTQGEIQTQLASDYGASQLSLGFLRRIVGKKGRQDARGKGFDLRTDLWGVIRAAMGLLITTEARRDAQGHAKDMSETVARLTQARDLHESLTGLAQRHGAQQQDADQSEVTRAIKAQNDGIRGGTPTDDTPFPELPERHLLIASADGTELTTAGSTDIASQENLALTTGGHVGLAAGKSFFATLREGFSLFVHQLGIKLIAASGKVRIEAQKDNIEIIAQKVIDLMSLTDSINLKAAKEITLHAGGTYVRISADEGYTVYTNGAHRVHAGDHQTDSAQTKPLVLPELPTGEVTSEWVTFVDHRTGEPIADFPYRLDAGNGHVAEGITNAHGRTGEVWTPVSQPVQAHIPDTSGTTDTYHVRHLDDVDGNA